jgi:hypothetical protein
MVVHHAHIFLRNWFWAMCINYAFSVINWDPRVFLKSKTSLFLLSVWRFAICPLNVCPIVVTLKGAGSNGGGQGGGEGSGSVVG